MQATYFVECCDCLFLWQRLQRKSGNSFYGSVTDLPFFLPGCHMSAKFPEEVGIRVAKSPVFQGNCHKCRIFIANVVDSGGTGVETAKQQTMDGNATEAYGQQNNRGLQPSKLNPKRKKAALWELPIQLQKAAPEGAAPVYTLIQDLNVCPAGSS